MKSPLIFVTIALAVSPASAQQGPGSKPLPFQTTPEASRKITFDNIEYTFAFSGKKGNLLTNEYLPHGQTLKNWTTLIGVRQYRGVRELKDVLPKYVAAIKPFVCIKPEILERSDRDTDEVIFVLWLKPADNAYLEYNLHRFVSTPDGVMAYQFAQRFPYQEVVDVTAAAANQLRLLGELGEVAFRVYEK